MNRLTEYLDSINGMEDWFGYKNLEEILYPNNNFPWEYWKETFSSILDIPDETKYHILILFCSLIANWTDEELDEYVNSFAKTVN